MKLLPLEEIVHRLDRVVSLSPCDETELVWFEIVRAGVTGGALGDTPPHSEATVLVRVREAERIGVYQTGAGTVGELCNAVRQALGQTRIESPGPWRCPPAPPSEQVEETRRSLVDRQLAELEPQAARERLDAWSRSGEDARLTWNVGRMVLANSRGLQQHAAATSVNLDVRCGGQEGAGRAAAAARSLADLRAEEVFDRARRCHAGSMVSGESESGNPDSRFDAPRGAPVVLSPEAVIALIGLLNHHALSARSFHLGTSALRDAVGREVFDPQLELVDDGTGSSDPVRPGLPFPFDLFGYGKRRVEMVRKGRLQTPAVDRTLSERLDLSPTPHGVAPEDSRASHLRLTAGDLTDRELLERAAGGLWIGWLGHPECFDAPNGRFRARARGLRRIVRGRLGPGIADRLCEGSFPEVFEKVAGLGRNTVCRAVEDGFRGGLVAPAMALPQDSALHLHTA